ncbi:MerR family transcriptional regulator [Nocardiopsis potens]|uniref:MerR family transcriptional regulator n=1 Tax=Nocardiopsis potens TaxID=1246458 RepID=UPI000347A677|nr:MerR family transcriptional regulator [Nocardiopsis potens]
MRIGELAERSGVSTRTLRYYESRGLLPARRAVNGHRVYGDGDLRLVREIRTLQDVGFSLEETRPFVRCLQDGHPAGDSCPTSLQAYRGKLAEIDALMERLRGARDRVSAQLLRAEARLSADAGPRCQWEEQG